MTAETTEQDLLTKTSDALEQSTDNPLHALLQEVAQMPEVDQAKVQAALEKLRNGTLGILGSETEQMASAERIAKRIIEESGG